MSYRRGFQLCKIYRLKCIGAHMLKLKNNLKPIQDGGYYFSFKLSSFSSLGKLLSLVNYSIQI